MCADRLGGAKLENKFRRLIMVMALIISVCILALAVAVVVLKERPLKRLSAGDTVKRFYRAVTEGDEETIVELVDWESLILQMQGAKYGTLSERKKYDELNRLITIMLGNLTQDGIIRKLLLDVDVRIGEVNEWDEVAEVTYFEFDRKTGKEHPTKARLHRDPKGRHWVIYRIPRLEGK